MKKTFFKTGLIALIVLTSAFTVEKEIERDFDENCVRPTTLASVLTLEESIKFKLSSTNDVLVPFIGNEFIGFREALGFKESRSRYHIVNKFGYLGKYQFGKSTLKRLKIYNVENFLRNPEQQERAFKALCSLNKHILRRDIKWSVGKKINGIVITESGILAAAHLSGAGNVKKYLRSNGGVNFNDAFGTSIQDYMKKFSGFNVSLIQASKDPLV